MAILGMLVSCFTTINLLLNRIGRNIAWVLVALMISVILLQVFCRYVLGNALPWPEEAARALMIWMMAMVAGEAYRRGSFVAIDMFLAALPSKASSALKLLLLLIAGAVLVKLTFLGVDFFERASALVQHRFTYQELGFTLPCPCAFSPCCWQT
ncbi:TRAP transporter small permease [Marinomonas fungiae]|uniref:TRAP transporter small permease protein n=1 Tax=Marinomonas fungiae TaxID=1137284 RepID=A0A0K6IMF6_9GAMM|nr:TRAP transporter small permease subunit [Marinomonas fungiae]CUB04278.1 Tripartite ATP-independent periplasmic transporters, DctQ component [Marinomonas fungiae]